MFLWCARSCIGARARRTLRRTGLPRSGGPVRRSPHEGSGETRLPGGVRGWPRLPRGRGRHRQDACATFLLPSSRIAPWSVLEGFTRNWRWRSRPIRSVVPAPSMCSFTGGKRLERRKGEKMPAGSQRSRPRSRGRGRCVQAQKSGDMFFWCARSCIGARARRTPKPPRGVWGDGSPRWGSGLAPSSAWEGETQAGRLCHLLAAIFPHRTMVRA